MNERLDASMSFPDSGLWAADCMVAERIHGGPTQGARSACAGGGQDGQSQVPFEQQVVLTLGILCPRPVLGRAAIQ